MPMPSYLISSNGHKLAYHHSKGKAPTVIFLPGFMSDMEGSKAVALEQHCRNMGQAFLRFDYSGHGQSEGAFEEGTIGEWAQDVADLLTKVINTDLVLIGSSMGGWISLLTATNPTIKPRVKAFIGIAAAPDFTDKIMTPHFTRSQLADLKTKGHTYLPSDYEDPYPITQKLLDDGKKQAVLDGPIELDIPIRLLQGDQDTAVPQKWPFKIKDMVTSNDVEVTIVKGGDHSLSTEPDLIRLMRTLDQTLNN